MFFVGDDKALEDNIFLYFIFLFFKINFQFKQDAKKINLKAKIYSK
jgi:hypothetical protein